ncbi:hypothetical protein BJ508DRAFT_160318 [Ascobolus immersus RN42]|uniref:Uncharacterized protein n=1 Tax=Ascobolus immersus RN42 TaxID=1160509 RepID=A0A3N4HYH3_ASCIM|nr:hypothetical protein BJ508DRAFT_160318 [Ascobolus immersus RN42]
MSLSSIRSQDTPSPVYIPDRRVEKIALAVALWVGFAIQTFLILWLVKIRRAESRRMAQRKALGDIRRGPSLDLESLGDAEDIDVSGFGEVSDKRPHYTRLDTLERH